MDNLAICEQLLEKQYCVSDWPRAERYDKPWLLQEQHDVIEICRGVISLALHYHVFIGTEANRVSTVLCVAPVTDLSFNEHGANYVAIRPLNNVRDCK